MPKDIPWEPQLPTGGNNIPESYLRRFSLKGSRGEKTDDTQPEDHYLARFLKDEL